MNKKILAGALRAATTLNSGVRCSDEDFAETIQDESGLAELVEAFEKTDALAEIKYAADMLRTKGRIPIAERLEKVGYELATALANVKETTDD